MSLDRLISDFLVDHRADPLTSVMWAATWLGNADTLRIATLGLTALALVLGRPFQAAAVYLGMLGADELVGGIKDLVGRSRPGSDLRAGDALSSYSFPSGHTTCTTVLVVLVLMVAWRSLPGERARRIAVCLGAGVAVAVGVSRIYLGYHWATDVAAGWVLGLVWSGAVLLAARALREQWRAAAARGGVGSPVPVPVPVPAGTRAARR